MSFTSQDRLKDAVLPLVRAMQPARTIRRQRAMERAITDDGYLKDRAIRPGTLTQYIDFDSASSTLSSSDTANYVAYMAETIHLPDGVWRFKARGALTGHLSSASNMNSQLWLNSNAGSLNFQIPLQDAGDTGTVFPRNTLDAVQGDVLLQLMFRPSAGTLTIEAGEWLCVAQRIG